MRILLIGGGDLVQQLVHYLTVYDKKVEVIGFVDDFAYKEEIRYGLPCLGPIENVLNLYAHQEVDAVMLGIGYNHFNFRQYLFMTLQSRVPFYTFIHPTAFIDDSATIGEGCCIGPRAVIEQRVVIDSNVFVYGGVNISHDSRIGAHSFVAPSVAIAGFVNIGSRCFLGLHSSIVERIKVADDITIGAGALVIHNLLEPGTYIGFPAHKK